MIYKTIDQYDDAEIEILFDDEGEAKRFEEKIKKIFKYDRSNRWEE